jgi:hypothetical protein
LAMNTCRLPRRLVSEARMGRFQWAEGLVQRAGQREQLGTRDRQASPEGGRLVIGVRKPSPNKISLQSPMHWSQMYMPGPATSFFTACALLQKRHFTCSLGLPNSVIPASSGARPREIAFPNALPCIAQLGTRHRRQVVGASATPSSRSITPVKRLAWIGHHVVLENERSGNWHRVAHRLVVHETSTYLDIPRGSGNWSRDGLTRTESAGVGAELADSLRPPR